MYKIYIEKTEKNDNFEAEIKEWEESRRWSNNRMNEEGPRPYTTKKYLDTVLTEEEFVVVKKAVLGVI